MKSTNISSSLGDRTPGLQEGLFLQPEELQKINTDIGQRTATANNAIAIATVTNALRIWKHK